MDLIRHWMPSEEKVARGPEEADRDVKVSSSDEGP
jgi:hypothetical protein